VRLGQQLAGFGKHALWGRSAAPFTRIRARIRAVEARMERTPQLGAALARESVPFPERPGLGERKRT
jgi:hypothetical protein